MSDIARRFDAVRDEIAKLTSRPVTICGVTKAQSPETVAQAIAAGLSTFGNNYVQEGEALRAALGDRAKGVAWQFIGHIQSRKAKSLVDYSLIQSLDRTSVAQELEKRATRPMDVLIEVNVGGEAQKSGVSPESFDAFLAELAPLRNLRVRGLMAMPPPLEPVEARRPYFSQMRELFEKHRFEILSMGTSADYRVAVEEGATMVRLGTTIFGPR